MANTTNFNWETPDDTDLVKDGAAAIRTLGSSIDTSFVDLKGGTTGQNLRKASNTDLDFTFAGDATNTVIDAAGDLLYGTASDTLGRLAIGTAGQVLKVNSGATAPEWGAAAAGGMTLLSTTTLSGTSTTISGISGDYVNLMIFIYGATTGAADTLTLAGNGTTSVASTSVDGGVAYSYGTRNVMGTAGPTLVNANNSFMYEIFDYADTTHYKNVRWAGIYAGGNYGSIGGGGYYSTSAITSFRVGTAAGTNSFSAGTVKIYGVK